MKRGRSSCLKELKFDYISKSKKILEDLVCGKGINQIVISYPLNKRIIEDVNKKFKRSKKENEVKESKASSESNFVKTLVLTNENEVKESKASSERNFVKTLVLTKENEVKETKASSERNFVKTLVLKNVNEIKE